jgi:hypothetical protein
MQLTLDDRLRVNENVVFRDLDGEAVLLHVERGTYFGLDPLGTRVWQSIVEHGSARNAIGPLLEEYEVPSETLENDVRRLLGELTAHDLIRPLS